MAETRFVLASCVFLLISGRCAAQQPVVVPNAKVNSPFTYQIQVDGGTAPYTFELADLTALPTGLLLDRDSGMISGTPAQARREAFTFAVLITDDSDPKQSVTQAFTLKVQPAPLRVIGATSALVVRGDRAAPSATSAPLQLVAATDLAAPGPPKQDPPHGAPQTKPAQDSAQDPPPVAPPKPDQQGQDAADQKKKQQSKPLDDTNKEWEARAIAGYHQAGASSAKFTQNFFFDFFISRALSSTHLWGDCGTDDKCSGGRWSMWGDVRIASTPQQVTTGVGTFATNFATEASNLPVNELAQSADFQTGLEFRLHTFVRKPDTTVLAYRTLGLVGYFGAQGAFQPPSAQAEIFTVPAKTSPQYASFAQQYAGAANSTYVAFLPPERERFFRNYGFGFRLTTFDKDQPLAPPGTYTFTVGQDESITGGIFRSVVGRFDVFYPLPTAVTGGKGKFVYLFGTTTLRFSKAANLPTFALAAAPSSVLASDPAVALVTVRSTRDTYRIGAGIDLVNLIQTIKTPTAPDSTKNTTKQQNQ